MPLVLVLCFWTILIRFQLRHMAFTIPIFSLLCAEPMTIVEGLWFALRALVKDCSIFFFFDCQVLINMINYLVDPLLEI